MTQFLWLAFITYLVFPLIDIPLLGLSISAPLLFLVFLEIFLRPHSHRIKDYGRWLVIGYLFLLGLLLSLVSNASFVDTTDLITMVRYSYWIICFIVTIIITSNADQLKNVGLVVAITILILVVLRLFEAVFFGRWGAWTNPQLLNQNSYGIQFSTFLPFTFVLPFYLRGRTRYVSSLGIILGIAAVAGNGSRSSWIAVAVGAIVFLVLYVLTQRRGIWIVATKLIPITGSILLLIAIVPAVVLEPIVARFETVDTLDTDKSFLVRQVMVQKALKILEDNPIFGIGIGRFRDTDVVLDLPDRLSYYDLSDLNDRSAHNSYMQLAGETGLAGIIPFATLHLLLFFNGLSSTLRLAKRGELWTIAIFSSYVGMSIHLWSLAGLTGTSPWFVYGLLAGVIERDRHLQDAVRG